MTRLDVIRHFSVEQLANWLALIEAKAIEHQDRVSIMSHDELEADWIDFLKEEDDENNSGRN